MPVTAKPLDVLCREGELLTSSQGRAVYAVTYEGIRAPMIVKHLSSFLGKTIELPLDEDLYYEELMKRVATSRLKENVKAVVSDTSNTYGGAK